MRKLIQQKNLHVKIQFSFRIILTSRYALRYRIVNQTVLLYFENSELFWSTGKPTGEELQTKLYFRISN